MARQARKPRLIVQIEPPKIPTPDHAPVTVSLSGNVYEYTEPASKLKHDKLQGMFFLAAAKMNQTMEARVLNNYARRSAESDNPEKEAQVIQREMQEQHSALIGAGALLAIEEIFNAVCAGLNLSPGARSYLEDHYETQELFAAYGVLLGLIMRPFGGTRKGIAPTRPTMTG
jgi:hypothetical protein